MICIDESNPIESRFLEEIAQGDPVARPVYADWLEEQGQDLRADYVRTQHDLLGAIDPASFDEHAHRLALLEAEVDPPWRDRLASPAIHERLARRTRQLRRLERRREHMLEGILFRPCSDRSPVSCELPEQLRYLEQLAPRTPPEPIVMEPRGGRR